MNHHRLVILLSLLALTAAPLRSENSHGDRPDSPPQKQVSRPTKPTQKAKQSITDYFEDTRKSNRSLLYSIGDQSYGYATHWYAAKKDGVFLNADGDKVSYNKGDILFQTQSHGWYKTHAFEEKELALEMMSEVIRLTNIERAKENLAPLTLSDSLMTSASEHAKWMMQTKNLEHTTKTVGENIALGQKTAARVVEEWMSSPGHRANILNPSYKTIGVSAWKTKSGDIYWAQQFLK